MRGNPHQLREPSGCLRSIPACAGNHRRGRSNQAAPPSIPACAGEPHLSRRFGALSRVYPRVCGGTTAVIEELQENGGLSPRVRGNRPIPQRVDGMVGSIPACAGEPRFASLHLTPPQVYPRVCGGTIDRPTQAVPTDGLSPRVRENQVPSHSPPIKAGSIPACAGEPSGGGGAI